MPAKLLLFASVLFLASCQPGPGRSPQSGQTGAAPASSTTDPIPGITLPPGFSIRLYAQVPDARSLCLGEKGTLFVGNRSGDKVYAVVDRNADGVADSVYMIAEGLNTPCGVAFRDGSLYVAEISRILRFDRIEDRLGDPPMYEVVYDQLPTDGHHGWKFIAFGPDGKLYVPVGAPCNVCAEDNPVYASITRMNPDGTGFEVFASGIRNTVGFAWHPETGQLWFTDNGRDDMGDNVPADELNTAPKAGMHFGFPFCHQGDLPDPRFGRDGACSSFTPPALKLTPHGAALGMRFYTGTMFPAAYRHSIFVAEHGSWNRTTPTGYRVMEVKMENGRPTAYVPFATGWRDADGNVTGRPVDVQVAPDGALFVSDDRAGAVYRIIFTADAKK
ncbi:MAG: sorbosone dehydrogenase family protein [Flaviaesturariibacter sp.]|nr:sorbosone dehydrogenase family protein [Flaviaesturariibacter sp.]